MNGKQVSFDVTIIFFSLILHYSGYGVFIYTMCLQKNKAGAAHRGGCGHSQSTSMNKRITCEVLRFYHLYFVWTIMCRVCAWHGTLSAVNVDGKTVHHHRIYTITFAVCFEWIYSDCQRNWSRLHWKRIAMWRIWMVMKYSISAMKLNSLFLKYLPCLKPVLSSIRSSESFAQSHGKPVIYSP